MSRERVDELCADEPVEMRTSAVVARQKNGDIRSDREPRMNLLNCEMEERNHECRQRDQT